MNNTTKKSEEHKFKKYIQNKGLKLTPERRSVLNGISSFKKHFDADELYKRIKTKGGKLSKATIYRSLPLFIESSIIKETMSSESRTIYYEHTFGHEHHDHLICIKCGRIIEFRDDEIERLQEKVCKEYSFKPIEHRLGIKGYCKECQTQNTRNE